MQLLSSAAIVAGGASGLGLATALHLRTLGAKVGVIDLKPNSAWDGPFATADVADEEAVERAFDLLTPLIGSARVLLNTTGTGSSGLSAGRNAKVTGAMFRRVLEVNTLGSFLLAKAAATRMFELAADEHGERGVIINTSSIVAFEGQIGVAAYAASKGGINAMTLPLAREFAPHGVRLVTIAPGIFETPMFKNARGPMVDWLRDQVQFPARPGDALEFAQFVEHIVANRMLNGEVIRLDGAYRVPPGRHDWWEA